MIGPGGLLLVVPHLFALPMSTTGDADALSNKFNPVWQGTGIGCPSRLPVAIKIALWGLPYGSLGAITGTQCQLSSA